MRRPTCPPWCTHRGSHRAFGTFESVAHEAPEIAIDLVPVPAFVQLAGTGRATVNVSETERSDGHRYPAVVSVVVHDAMLPADALRLAAALVHAATLAGHRSSETGAGR